METRPTSGSNEEREQGIEKEELGYCIFLAKIEGHQGGGAA